MRNRNILVPATALVLTVACVFTAHVKVGTACLNVLSRYRGTLNTLKASGASESAIEQEWIAADKLYEPFKEVLTIIDSFGVIVAILSLGVIITRLARRRSSPL